MGFESDLRRSRALAGGGVTIAGYGITSEPAR